MKLITTLVTGLALVAPFAIADDGGRGLEIAKERKARDTGWGDSQAEMTMILRNSTGNL